MLRQATFLLLATAAAAQCQLPTALQQIATPFTGTMFEGAALPPNYGVNLDPGIGIRFDLVSDAPIEIASVGINVLGDGGNYGMPVPNLIGAANGTLEVWIAPGRSVRDAGLFSNITYRHNPPSAPPAPWSLLSNQPTHVSNLVWSDPDTPSTASFSPPLSLPAGSYACVLVAVPRGVATIPAGAGVAANPATDRIHPLLTNLAQLPGPSSFQDGVLSIANAGIQVPAFSATAKDATSVPPVLPNFALSYRLGANTAYQARHGIGCYDRKQTFYESFLATGVIGGSTIDLSPGSLALRKAGSSYFVEGGQSSYPRNGVTPGSTSWYRINHPTTPTHVNTTAPATSVWGDWDDATSQAYPLPFGFPFPGDGGVPATHMVVGSNGAIWLRSAQPATQRFLDDYQGWLDGPPSLAVAYCDLYPADRFTLYGGAGDIYVDSDGSSYVTISWVAVTEYPSGASTGTLNSFQLTLLPNGNAEFTYGRIRHGANNLLVGFTPGNGCADPGSGSTPRAAPGLRSGIVTGGFLSGDGASPASLRLAQRPKVGVPLVFETQNLDATAVLNITLVSAAPAPGIDLAALGMRGCAANVMLPEIASFAQLALNRTATWPALNAVPAVFAGYDLYAQSVQLCTGSPVSYNATNVLVSNGVCMRFDRN